MLHSFIEIEEQPSKEHKVKTMIPMFESLKVSKI